MLHLPQEYIQILRDLRDTTDNPFYWLERRREGRKAEPWKGVWNAIFLLATVFSVTLGGIWVLMREGVAPEFFEGGRIPQWLGGGDGGRAAFAFLAATHCLLVFYTARNLANRVLTTEARRGSLFLLLLARLPAFEMVLEMTVYPFQQAMLIAAAGLPFYAILVSFGSVGIQEVLVLYLLFGVMAVAVPNWRTPAFAEQSPEEIGQLLRDQERAAGWAATIIGFGLLPGILIAGAIINFAHWTYPAVFGKIPAEVWPALQAFPLTFAWVTVRVLTAPYTWFGLPTPPWVLLVPVLLLYRLASLWKVSLYLRVASVEQLRGLPDVASIARFRAGVRQVILIGLVGYVWQPLLESGICGAFVWPNSAGTDAENVSAFLYLTAIPAFFVAMIRATRLGSTSVRAWKAAGKGWLWLLAPFLPFAVSLISATLTMPTALFSVQAGTILLHLLPAILAMLYFGMSLGQGTGGEWQAIAVLPPFLALVPLAVVSALSCLSPIMLVIVANPAILDWTHRNIPWYHVPPWWAAFAVPLMAGIVCQWLSARGLIVRRAADDARPAIQVKVGAITGAGVVPPPAVAQRFAAASQTIPSGHVDGAGTVLDFHLGDVLPPSTPPGDAALPAPPPVVAAHAGLAASPVMSGPSPLAPPPPQQFPHEVYPSPVRASGAPPTAAPTFGSIAGTTVQRAGSQWRMRPMSPLAAVVMRWLSRRTDNPVALYSARRVLPGTLNTDQLTVAMLALGLIMLVAFLVPLALVILVIPVPVAAVIFPPIDPMILRSPQYQPAIGMGLVLAFLVGITLAGPWTVCKTVADGFRMERERSTLGFLLLTPLSSRGVALGHCVGALLPALVLWAGSALCALIPTALLAGLYEPFDAFWAWGFGFFISLMYLVMCTVVGMWIGITEVKARDMTIGVYLLPFAFCVIAIGCAYYVRTYWNWNYFQYSALFIAICLGQIAWLWQNAMKELYRMRRGDVPFEGRSVSN